MAPWRYRLFWNLNSSEFLVIGAYPPIGTYDECTTIEDRPRALKTIRKVAAPRKDPEDRQTPPETLEGSEMTEYVIRFLVGDAVVSAFAMLGDLCVQRAASDFSQRGDDHNLSGEKA